MPFDISKESFEGYCKAYDGVYVVSEEHVPGLVKGFPVINNRGFVFEADNQKNGKHLLMSGLPGPSCIPKLQAIEKDTGLKLRKIVSSGDNHHLAMKDWLEAYPEAHFVHSALKFPETRNGKEIMANESYKSRIELCEGPTFPSLIEEYGDILEFVGFNQMLHIPDVDFSTKDTKNPTELKGFGFLKKLISVKPTVPILAIWLYHKPSKQLLMEHTFGLYFSKKQLASCSIFLLKLASKPNDFKSCACDPVPTAPSDMESIKKHCDQVQALLALDVASITDYHTDLGVHIREFENKEQFVEEMTKVLEKTGENDPTGQALYDIKNKKSLFHLLRCPRLSERSGTGNKNVCVEIPASG